MASATLITSFPDSDSHDDIAIIGMACRLPGGIDSIEKFWQTILSKKDTSGSIPLMRWEPYYRRDSRNPEILEKTTSKGYFLDKLEDFDASFFGISPLEAEMMDPQQRIALEVTWEALEHAGLSATSLAGSNTAVFMGVNSDDYSKLLLEDIPGVEAWMGIGTAFCGIPNRISYALDLHGPSSAVDAACASSLVAVHHGRQALLAGETNLAIVGGVNALIGPGLTRVLDKAGAVTPEGCCKSFDAAASGYGRGEGASILILKRLEDSIIDGNKILAVLKGSAVGQDGKTNGIMAPNQAAQASVAKKALATARVDPLTVEFVEAHATSTPVGDPCEVAAIASVYGSGCNRENSKPCLIGSVKPNVGHLEAGAGSTSLIKAVLAVDRGVFPPQANFTTPNPKMDWDNIALKVSHDAIPWESNLKRAGISSYGYGGTVSHAIIEQPPLLTPAITPLSLPGDVPSLILLSSPQVSRIKDIAGELADWIPTTTTPLGTVANTLGLRRSHHSYRVALVADDKDDAVDILKNIEPSSKGSWVVQNKASAQCEKGVVWVFSGHGAHWENMAKELLEKEPIFTNAIAPIDFITREVLGFSIIKVLADGAFQNVDQQQVSTYAMQIGIAAVLRSRGMQPAAIIGHSVGEIAASVIAGCLTVCEGAYVVSKRALLYRGVAGEGGMILVDMTIDDAGREISAAELSVTIAIHSSPSTCVLSGDIDSIEKAMEHLSGKNIKVRRVKTDVAFHSPVLNDLAEPLRELLRNEIHPSEPTIPLYSTSLGDPRGEALRDEKYWVDNMVNPVWLHSAATAALEDGFRVFMEISAHPIVSHSINETIIESEIDATIFPTLKREQPAMKSLLFALANIHCCGVQLKLDHTFAGDWSRDVPRTKWVHKPFWRQVGTGSQTQAIVHNVKTHTFLGGRNHIFASNISVWNTLLDNSSKPFPGSHPLHGTEIVPAAVLLNTFLHAGKCNTLKNVVLRVPVAINAPRELQVVSDRGQVSLSSRLKRTDESQDDDSSWLTHTTATLALTKSNDIPGQLNIPDTKVELSLSVDPEFTTNYLASVGVPEMGFPWKVLEHFGTGDKMLCKVDTAPGCHGSPPWAENSWAPVFDAATSIGSSIFHKEPVLRMPTQVEEVTTVATQIPKIVYIYVTVASGLWCANVTIFDDQGHVVAQFNKMRFSTVEGNPGVSSSLESLVHQISWPPARLEDVAFGLKHVTFLAEKTDRLDQYIQELYRRKITTSVISEASEIAALDHGKGSIVAFLPPRPNSTEEIFAKCSQSCDILLQAAKTLIENKIDTKLWCITQGVFEASDVETLGQSPLAGLTRIIASEHPEIWGGFVDTDDESFPLQAVKYVRGSDVISVRDSVARIARLRSIPRQLVSNREESFMPKPSGTYLITGGLGALGLEVAAWMVEKGARRIVLVSRRSLPPRRNWKEHELNPTIQAIKTMELVGASIYVLSVDIGSENSGQLLEDALDDLDLPQITGVVHAAGILEDQLVTETTKEAFDRVLQPKISGAMAIHQVFPPGSLDFLVLFSSCGQLLGFAGQASYASGNAFLDSFADYRRNEGDNVLSFLWTSWRGLGMASSSEYIEAELETKGVTSISKDEGFRAWEYAMKHDVHQAVVLRALPVDENDTPLLPILDEIAPRKRADARTLSATIESFPATPRKGKELKDYLRDTISQCVATTLRLESVKDVDPTAALTELGMDSVMTVSLRRHLQSSLKVKVPPTLIWGHPTVSHLVNWFEEQLRDKT